MSGNEKIKKFFGGLIGPEINKQLQEDLTHIEGKAKENIAKAKSEIRNSLGDLGIEYAYN